MFDFIFGTTATIAKNYKRNREKLLLKKESVMYQNILCPNLTQALYP